MKSNDASSSLLSRAIEMGAGSIAASSGASANAASKMAMKLRDSLPENLLAAKQKRDLPENLLAAKQKRDLPENLLAAKQKRDATKPTRVERTERTINAPHMKPHEKCNRKPLPKPLRNRYVEQSRAANLALARPRHMTAKDHPLPYAYHYHTHDQGSSKFICHVYGTFEWSPRAQHICGAVQGLICPRDTFI